MRKCIKCCNSDLYLLDLGNKMKIHKRLERANLKQDPNQDKLKITSFCPRDKLLTLVKAHV